VASVANTDTENRAGTLNRPAPVALEVLVSVTGARAGGATRELFTEETNTVLVFRDGAVIRLEAAVALGQLLFLTDKRSKAEVVCQVLNTRPCNQNAAYVDLQFTEQKDSFWDVPFPANNKAAAVEVSVKQHVEAEALTTGSPSKAVEPHKAEDVDKLRREVEALRKQLADMEKKSATPPAAKSSALPTVDTVFASPKPLEPTFVTPPKPAAPPSEPAPKNLQATQAVAPERRFYASEEEGQKAIQSGSHEAPLMPAANNAEKQEPKPSVIGMSLPTRAPDPPAEPEPESHLPEAEAAEALLPKPALDFSQAPNVVVQPPLTLVRRRNSFKLYRVAMDGLVVVLGLGLVATLFFFQPWKYLGARKSDAPAVANSVPAKPSPAKANAAVKNTAKANQAKTDSDSNSADASGDAPQENADASASDTNASSNRALSGKKPSVAKARTKASEEPAVPAPSESTADTPVEPAKLIKAATPVYPPDAMLNFITGDVRTEGVVEPDGRIDQVQVLSGPKPLREAAIDALKHYQYTPATQGGKAVASKVTVTVKFWFDP
jgi:periplasmic protein TonB